MTSPELANVDELPIAPPVDPDLGPLIGDYLDALADIEKFETLRDQYEVQILARVPVGGRVEVAPGLGIRVQGPSLRFDAKLAASVLTPEQLAAISVAKPDATQAKKLLPGVLVEQCSKAAGRPSVRAL